MKNISYIILILLFASCNVNKSVVGKYRSRFPVAGFFTTRIELKTDSTFIFEESGDLQYTKIGGKYKVLKNNIYLRFKKLKREYEDESLIIDKYDTIANLNRSDIHYFDLKNEDGIEYHLKYEYSKMGLQVHHVETDELVTEVKYWSNNKWKMRKFYLKKVKK